MELIIVLVIALLVLGPKKLPEVGRSVGRGIREFKSSVTGDGDDDDRQHAELIAQTTETAPAHGETTAVPAGRS